MNPGGPAMSDREEMPEVGDGPCGRCGGNNPVVWFASPNERWNEVYGHAGGIRCPNCFFADAIEKGFDRVWVFIPEDEKELAWQSRWEHGRAVGREESRGEYKAELTEKAAGRCNCPDPWAAHPEGFVWDGPPWHVVGSYDGLSYDKGDGLHELVDDLVVLVNALRKDDGRRYTLEEIKAEFLPPEALR